MVVVVVCQSAVLFRQPTAAGHVGLATNNWLDANLLSLAIELNSAKHVPVIRHRDGGLIERLDLADQRIDLIGTVQEAELGVEMKVYKG